MEKEILLMVDRSGSLSLSLIDIINIVAPVIHWILRILTCSSIITITYYLSPCISCWHLDIRIYNKRTNKKRFYNQPSFALYHLYPSKRLTNRIDRKYGQNCLVKTKKLFAAAIGFKQKLWERYMEAGVESDSSYGVKYSEWGSVI